MPILQHIWEESATIITSPLKALHMECIIFDVGAEKKSLQAFNQPWMVD